MKEKCNSAINCAWLYNREKLYFKINKNQIVIRCFSLKNRLFIPVLQVIDFEFFLAELWQFNEMTYRIAFH